MHARSAAVLVAASLLFAAPVALARAGGGESYSSDSSPSDSSSGSSSSDSSFGSSSSDSSSSWSSSEYSSSGSGRGGGGGFGALVLLGFLAVVVFVSRRMSQPASPYQKLITAQLARPGPSAAQQSAWVQQLTARDPAFDLLAFQAEVRALFVRIQEAWFARDLSPARGYLSDATFRRFQTQLGLLQLQGIRDAIADYQVREVRLFNLERRGAYDCLQVQIDAAMRDTAVPASCSDQDARNAALRTPLESFTEVWTLIRRHGAQTKAGLGKGACPNCGAPYAGGATNVCTHCSAVVNSGQYSWVLAGITQQSELRARAAPAGLAAAQERDPELSLDVLEDRAGLLFFRWIDAEARASGASLAKVATAEQVGVLERRYAAAREVSRPRRIADCAVGSIETLAITDHPGGQLAAHVEVRWSARVSDGQSFDELARTPVVPRRFVLTLVRSAEARSNPGSGLSTDRCAACNAALADSLSPSCEFCGVLLNDGAKDWVLDGIYSFETWTAAAADRVPLSGSAALPPELPFDLGDRERLLHLLAAVALADGAATAQERRLLKDFSRHWSVSWANLEAALARPSPDVPDVVPGTPAAEALLRSMIAMARADGTIDKHERALLSSAAVHLRLTDKAQAWMS